MYGLDILPKNAALKIYLVCIKRTSQQLQIRLVEYILSLILPVSRQLHNNLKSGFKSTFYLKIICPSESVQTFIAGLINYTEFWWQRKEKTLIHTFLPSFVRTKSWGRWLWCGMREVTIKWRSRHPENQFGAHQHCHNCSKWVKWRKVSLCITGHITSKRVRWVSI